MRRRTFPVDDYKDVVADSAPRPCKYASSNNPHYIKNRAPQAKICLNCLDQAEEERRHRFLAGLAEEGRTIKDYTREHVRQFRLRKK